MRLPKSLTAGEPQRQDSLSENTEGLANERVRRGLRSGNMKIQPNAGFCYKFVAL